MGSTRETWQRLGTAIRQRRTDLDLGQAEVAQRAGISISTLSALERAKQDDYEDRTLARVEDALGWARGSVDAIKAGGKASLLDDAGRPTYRVEIPTGRVDVKAWVETYRQVDALPEEKLQVLNRLIAEAIAELDARKGE
ncbi:helix-turn-helix domain-containing protein [Nonomuraea sp. NPDC059194]|uniref:helix-turn-helix domain-containing protein n=1 Tax=Nonomuraea sp. NPDC059194 TaxID=3346764 RepID=UPI0036BED088